MKFKIYKANIKKNLKIWLTKPRIFYKKQNKYHNRINIFNKLMQNKDKIFNKLQPI